MKDILGFLWYLLKNLGEIMAGCFVMIYAVAVISMAPFIAPVYLAVNPHQYSVTKLIFLWLLWSPYLIFAIWGTHAHYMEWKKKRSGAWQG